MLLSPKIPPKLEFAVTLPASKSVSNRVLLLRALCPKSGCALNNLAECDDVEHMRRGIEAKLSGVPLIDVGATGTAMRFLTAYFAVTPGEVVLTGSERMQQRPIAVLVNALRALGADIEYVNNEGFPPLRIRGKELQGGDLEVEASVSSQYISALLMIAPYLVQGLRLRLSGNVASRTYIELTLDLMKRYGAVAKWTDGRTICVSPGMYEDIPFTVEADWSAASYWYEVAAIAVHMGHDVDIALPAITPNSLQGDRVVASLFEELGVRTEYTEEGVRLLKSQISYCKSQLEIDFTHCPDIVQTMAVTHCLLGVPYIYKGVHSLRIKETDRVAALIAELRKLGYVLHAEGDERLIWNGTRCEAEKQPTIATYEDHRMAMAFAPAALLHKGLTIEHPEVVTKSYPTFWEELKRIDNSQLTLNTKY